MLLESDDEATEDVRLLVGGGGKDTGLVFWLTKLLGGGGGGGGSQQGSQFVLGVGTLSNYNAQLSSKRSKPG
jgi:hypothetical protein